MHCSDSAGDDIWKAITAVSEVLISSVSQWEAVLDRVAKGLPSAIKSRTGWALFRRKKKKEMSGNISQYSPWVHMQVKEKSTCWFNMPPLGNVVLWGWGGRRRGRDGCTWPELCKPGRTVLSKLSSVMKVKHWLNIVSNDCSGAVRVVRPSVMRTFFKNMYNTLHSNVFIFTTKKIKMKIKSPMITSLKHSESFSWDIIIYKDLPLCCETGPCKKTSTERPVISLISDSVR